MSGLFVKVCGIMDAGAARTAAGAGADAIGFIFHRPSRRYVPPEAAASFAEAAREAAPASARAAGAPGPARVGVFVDAHPEEIAAAAARVPLDYVQLHGDESPGFAAAVVRATGCRVIKALRVASATDLSAAEAIWRDAAGEGRPAFFLLDTLVPGEAGGTGQSFDWRLTRQACLPAPVILAGGLTPANVVQALAEAGPAGVDVSSGVESGGVKRPDLIRAFVAAVRGWQDGRESCVHG